MLLHLLVRTIGSMGARAAEHRARHRFVTNPRILLVNPGHIGTLVMTTPIFHALKAHAPGADVTLMVGPGSLEVVERHPDTDHFISCSFPSPRKDAPKGLSSYILLLRTVKQLRSGNYDLAVNLRPDFWWVAASLFLAHIPRRIGYAVEPSTPLFTEALPLPPREHSVASYLRLVSASLRTLGYAVLPEPYTAERYPLCFVPTIQEQEWVLQYLHTEAIELSTSLVVIHPGTGGDVKLWRPEGWVACANALLAQATSASTPVHLVLTGVKSEQSLLEEIARSIPAHVTIVTDMTLGQLAALFQRARLMLGVDSGPLHVAAAQETPTVAIFGPTDPRIFGPWGRAEQHAVVAATQRCSSCSSIPCMELDFIYKDPLSHPCVRMVPEQAVTAVALQQFSSLIPAGA